MCCVPTLLATLEEDHPRLRFLLVSGESCPQDLIGPLAPAGPAVPQRLRSDRGDRDRDLDVAASDRPVTIGVPLPTYSVVILDPTPTGRCRPARSERSVSGGIGLADGYVGRAELTARAFVPDFIRSPATRRAGSTAPATSCGSTTTARSNITAGSIPRSRSEATGSRWPRSKSVLWQVPGIAQAVVEAHEPEPGAERARGLLQPARGTSPAPTPAAICAHLRGGCPPT